MVKRKGARDGRDNKRLNLILVLAIAAIACVGLVATRLMGANTNADTATVVIRDGEQNVYELPLSQNTTKSVTTDLGTNLIEIKDGRVHVERIACTRAGLTLPGSKLSAFRTNSPSISSTRAPRPPTT